MFDYYIMSYRGLCKFGLTINGVAFTAATLYHPIILAHRLIRKVSLSRTLDWFQSSSVRALPDITSALEVRQTFQMWTVRKPDIFLPGHQT